MHEHQAWQIADDGDGRMYCQTCGGALTDTQVREIRERHQSRMKKQADEIRAAQNPTVVGELIDGRRGIYGDPAVEFPKVAQVWSGILGFEVHAYDVPLMLIGYKLVRAARTPDYSDNSDDVEGYLAIFRELLGDDMVHARSIEEYLEKRKHRD